MNNNQKLPLIFNIHRGSIDDGPGIRSVVFFKGCPLNCVWCHNPESIDPKPEMLFYPAKCICCGRCKNVCTRDAINLEAKGRIEREACISCGACAKVCPALAINKVGRPYSLDELFEILMLDREFYKVSGGGVTFSGGEPLMHIEYLEGIMKKLNKGYINIAIQTSGFFDFNIFKEKILSYIDLVFYDIKFINSDLHKKFTSRDNAIILQNFLNIAKEKDIKLIPRIPLIPGITAEPENLLAIADFIREAGLKEYVLLPYDDGGIDKRLSMGKKGMMPDVSCCIDDERQCQEIFQKKFFK